MAALPRRKKGRQNWPDQARQGHNVEGFAVCRVPHIVWPDLLCLQIQ